MLPSDVDIRYLHWSRIDISEKHTKELVEVTDKYELLTNELKCLLEQDKYDDFKDEANWPRHDQTVSQAYEMVKRTRAYQSDRHSVASSRC